MMRLIAAVAVVAAASFATPASAAAEPFGTLCGLAATNDLQIPDTYTGVLFGGPVTFGDTRTLALECTVQVNAGTHAGTDVCEASAVTGAPVSAAAAHCNYFQMPGDNVYVCTAVHVTGGPTLYFDHDDPSVPGGPGDWTTSSSASCGLATTVAEQCDLSCEESLRVLLPFVCPVLAVLLPPHGDLAVLVDCPPFNKQQGVRIGGLTVRVPTVHPPTP